MREIILINISGKDRPGLLAEFSGILALHNISVLDVGQSVQHGTISLAFTIELPAEAQGYPVLQEFLFKGHDDELLVHFSPMTEDDYESWVGAEYKPRHFVTLLGRSISAAQIKRVADVVAGNALSIESISRLSGRIPLNTKAQNKVAALEMQVMGKVDDIARTHSEFLHIAQEMDVDIAIQEDSVYRRHRRLVCFDMDSTLIQAEVIDELAKEAGIGEQVAAITESAMRGEIDFSESFRRRMALLKGLDVSVLESIAQRLPITEGADRLIFSLRKLGYRVAILSGGFTYFAEHLQGILGVDYVHANHLDIVDGKLTGEVKGEIIDGQKKAQYLRELADQEGIALEQVIAVGDGANDLPMLSIAGLGVAFHAKPIVKEQARHSIATLGLDGVLYLLGLRDREIATLLKE